MSIGIQPYDCTLESNLEEEEQLHPRKKGNSKHDAVRNIQSFTIQSTHDPRQ